MLGGSLGSAHSHQLWLAGLGSGVGVACSGSIAFPVASTSIASFVSVVACVLLTFVSGVGVAVSACSFWGVGIFILVWLCCLRAYLYWYGRYESKLIFPASPKPARHIYKNDPSMY